MTKNIPKTAFDSLPISVVLGAAGRANAEFEKAAGFKNLRAQYMGILWLVAQSPGHPQGTYAAALHYDLATFGRHVEALVLDGLMNKIQAEHDHRVMELTVTKSGHAALEVAQAQFDQVEDAMRDKLGAKNLSQISDRMHAYLSSVRLGD
ncbi:MAG: hypothetical protein HRU32_12215 [Rhodobacteraceae bacterium]|nr:hypothetical protein [Paracoccaceae bacterium]